MNNLPKTTLAQKSAASMIIPIFMVGINSKELPLQMATIICSTAIAISIVVADAMIRRKRAEVHKIES